MPKESYAEILTANTLREHWKLNVLSTSRPYRAPSMEQQTVYWKQGEPWLACCSHWPAASSLERQHSCPKVFYDPPPPPHPPSSLTRSSSCKMMALQGNMTSQQQSMHTLSCSALFVSWDIDVCHFTVQGTSSRCPLRSRQQPGPRVRIMQRCW